MWNFLAQFIKSLQQNMRKIKNFIFIATTAVTTVTAEERTNKAQDRKTCTRNQNETSSEKDSKLSLYRV